MDPPRKVGHGSFGGGRRESIHRRRVERARVDMHGQKEGCELTIAGKIPKVESGG